MKILIGFLYCVSICARAPDFDLEDKIGASATAHANERLLSEPMFYKGVIDVFDSPIQLPASMNCVDDRIPSYSPTDAGSGDLFQLNLQANYCYTIQVNSRDFNDLALSVYEGLARAVPSLNGTTFLVQAEEREVKLAPLVDGGEFTLSVYTRRSVFGYPNYCVDPIGYEIEIAPEKCLAGEVTYAGVINVSDEISTTEASIPCVGSSTESIPEYWHLWKLNLSPQYCHSVRVNRIDCDMNPFMSIYEGIANRAVPGSDVSDPDALEGASLLGWTLGNVSKSETKYCARFEVPYASNLWKGEDPRLDLNRQGGDGVYTLAIQYGGNACFGGSYKYEIVVEPRLCDSGLLRGLRGICSKDTECKSGLCTGRPGKAKKCRFCARKNEICVVDEDCCQSEKFPGRYCDNGQCKKNRSSPARLLAQGYGGDDDDTVFVVDTTTGAARNPLGIPDRVWNIEYDAVTGILYAQGQRWEDGNSVHLLYKINVNSGAVIETLSLNCIGDKVRCYNNVLGSVNGKLYSVQDMASNCFPERHALVTVDTSTGALTEAGRIATTPGTSLLDAVPAMDSTRDIVTIIQDMAYDGKTMYATARYQYYTGRNKTNCWDYATRSFVSTSPEYAYATGQYLVTIDLDKAIITSSVLIASPTTAYPAEIAFGSNGVLYAAWADTAGSLYSLDKTTGEISYIGKTGGERFRIGGLTFAS